MTAADASEVFDLVHESVFVRDPQGRITVWNKASEELYGWPREQAVGRLAQELLRSRYPNTAEAAERQLRETGRWEGEVVRITARDAEVIIDAGWMVRRAADGQPAEIVETGRDA